MLVPFFKTACHVRRHHLRTFKPGLPESAIFTVDYWTLGRSRLRGWCILSVGTTVCPTPDGMRSLIASFIHVFPNTWLFEIIPGSMPS